MVRYGTPRAIMGPQPVKRLALRGIKAVGRSAAKRMLSVAKSVAKKKAMDSIRKRLFTVKKAPAKRMQYKTTGTYDGPVRASPVLETAYYNHNGVVFRQENGGAISDDHAVYIGHSTCPTETLLLNVCRVIVKKLFEKAGQTVRAFENLPDYAGQGYAMNFRYRKTPQTTAASAVAPVPALGFLTGSYDNIAILLRDEINTVFTANDVPQMLSITLYWTDAAVVTPKFEQRATIDLQNFRLEFNLKSKLKIQNTTLANVVETDGNKDSMEDIESNPIEGALYTNQGKWKNYLLYQSATSGVLPVTVAHHVDGRMEATSTSVATTELKKPPLKAWQFGCRNKTKVIMDPGKIKYSELDFKASMMFNSFLTKMANTFVDSTQPYQTEFGNCAIFGLEKMLASRQANPSQVRVAWQIDNTIKIAGISRRNTYTNEHIQVL